LRNFALTTIITLTNQGLAQSDHLVENI